MARILVTGGTGQLATALAQQGGDRVRVVGRPAFDFDDVIYGIHSIEEALLAGERLRAIHVADDRKKDNVLRVLLARAKELNVPVRFEQPVAEDEIGRLGARRSRRDGRSQREAKAACKHECQRFLHHGGNFITIAVIL